MIPSLRDIYVDSLNEEKRQEFPYTPAGICASYVTQRVQLLVNSII